MKYLLLLSMVTACSPKDFRLYKCHKDKVDSCRLATYWPLTDEECMDKVSRGNKNNDKFIYICGRVKR